MPRLEKSIPHERTLNDESALQMQSVLAQLSKQVTRVFVTGAGGFLGHALCSHLCSVGIDVVGFSRKTYPELSVIPIVALTAHGDSDVEKIARSAGCDGFLLKPADVRDIRDVLQQFLNPSPAC